MLVDSDPRVLTLIQKNVGSVEEMCLSELDFLASVETRLRRVAEVDL